MKQFLISRSSLNAIFIVIFITLFSCSGKYGSWDLVRGLTLVAVGQSYPV